jgi:hypothetical protein
MLFIEILGDRETFLNAALPSMDGVFYDDHAQRPLDDGTWRVAVFVATQDIVTQIESTGLTVNVLQTDDEVQAELDAIDETFSGGGATS